MFVFMSCGYNRRETLAKVSCYVRKPIHFCLCGNKCFMWSAYFCMGAYKCDVVVVIEIGAYILMGVLIFHGCLLSWFYWLCVCDSAWLCMTLHLTEYWRLLEVGYQPHLWITWSGMGGGDNGCGSGLLGVTSNKISYDLQIEQHLGECYFHLGNVTILFAVLG